jgi:hypothetical protein
LMATSPSGSLSKSNGSRSLSIMARFCSGESMEMP